MIRKIVVFLRPIRYLIKLFFYSPKYLYERISSDFKKDLNSKKLKKKFHIVWCAGLAKSGTTLIEDILRELPLVQANNSFFRIYDDSNIDYFHGISEQMFSKLPKNKLTFLKTHSHFTERYVNIANKYNSKIIISLRDIRDATLSRYYHIMNDKNDFQHNVIKNLKFKEGFLKTAKEHGRSTKKFSGPAKLPPAVYHYKWVQDWQSYAKNNSNCLVLWYEEFTNNPKTYIKKIIEYLEFDHIDVDKLYLKLNFDKQLLKKRGLTANLNLFEPKTFNKGTSGEWKKILDKETLENFYSILPDDISKIEYKN